jgi:nitrite reductase/ring-hydroxylating ferredoxin subunit
MPDNDDLNFKLDTGYGVENPALEHAFWIVEEAKPPKARTRGRLTVCAAAEIPPGSKRIVTDGTLSIGVFNVNGTFHAIRNVCPHMGAPLCAGSVHGTHRPSGVHEYDPAYAGRIIRCPWHGWEFDIVTGKGLFDRDSRVATYVVEVDDEGDVVVLV